MHDFVTLFIGHWENICSLTYSDLMNVDPFHYTIPKKFSGKAIMNLIRKDFKCWEIVKFTMVDSSFPNFNFLSKAQILSEAKIPSVVFLEVTGLPVNLKKLKSVPNTQSDNPSFACQSFFQVKMMFHENISWFYLLLNCMNFFS